MFFTLQHLQHTLVCKLTFTAAYTVSNTMSLRLRAVVKFIDISSGALSKLRFLAGTARSFSDRGLYIFPDSAILVAFFFSRTYERGSAV